MAKNRIVYIFLLITAVVLACAYNSKLTFVLLLAVIFLPCATFFLLVLERLALKIDVTPKSIFSQKLCQIGITVSIRNRFIIPASPVKLVGAFQDDEGNIVSDKVLIVSVMPFRKTELIFNGCIKYRGEYMLGLREAYIFDLLGIFRFKIRLEPDCSVIIAPRRLSIEQNNALCSDDYDSARTRMSFLENNTYSSVREYNDGDSLRYVHWKLSAKQDKLMVKQMEQNLGTNAMVITDTASFSEEEEDNIRAVDAAIEASLAITAKIISDGRCAVNLFRSSEDKPTDVFFAESIDDYEKLYFGFSVLPILQKGGAARMVNECRERFGDSETVFIASPYISAESMRYMLGNGLDSCKSVRVFLTGGSPSEELIALAETDNRLKIAEINTDDIALSLRNSLSE